MTNTKNKPIQIGYLLSNPIQYQTPLMKALTQMPDIELEVLFQSKRSLKPHSVPGFNVVAQHDVDLLDGFHADFLPCLGSDEHFSFFKPWNYGLLKRFLTRKYDVLWVHGYSSFFNLYAIFLAKLLGMKVLVRGESHVDATKKGKWRERLRKPFFSLLNKFVDGFLTIGSANQAFYQHFNIPQRKLFFARYTVDNVFFQSKIQKASKKIETTREALKLEKGKPIILYASSMLARKHPEDLLEAYANLSPNQHDAPAAYLIFVGDGEQRAFLEKRAKELGWETIKFLGFKNQTELPVYYALCDIFVLPSEGETWGLVINEAMNAGKAIITTKEVGSGRDLVKTGINGEIYSARDVMALTNIFNDLLKHPEKIQSMGNESLLIINQWGINETAQGVREACYQVMKQGKKYDSV